MVYPNVVFIGCLILVVSNLYDDFVDGQVYGFIQETFWNIWILKRYLPI